MSTVNLDFELFNDHGESLGDCWEYCADQIKTYIRQKTERQNFQEAEWATDYQFQLRLNKHADMFGEQYAAIKNYYTPGESGLSQSILDRILEEFKD